MTDILPTLVPNLVEVRCDPCARDLGQASPLLGQVAWNGARLTIFVAERQSGRRRDRSADSFEAIFDRLPELRQAHERLHAHLRQTYPAAPDRDTHRRDRSQMRPLKRNENPRLACRRCGNRPRSSRRSLYSLAESGRRIVYV